MNATVAPTAVKAPKRTLGKFSPNTTWLAILLGLLLPWVAGASAVTLEWDANVEPEVTGYRVYYGKASRSYSHVEEAGSNTFHRIVGLAEGETFYFAVTAIADGGFESDFSEEVFCTIPRSEPAPLQIVPMRLERPPSGSGLTLCFEAEAGRQFAIQVSEDLQAWRLLTTLTASVAGPHAWTDSHVSLPMCFYRVVRLP